MFKRWLALLCGLVALVALCSCEVGTPPPIETPSGEKQATPTPPPPPTTTPLPWPAERFVFAYLDKVWLADNAAPRVLTVGAEPALSPDGQRVAYLLTISPTLGTRQVYVLDLTTSQISLVSGPPDLYGPPVWSPDSNYVAYVNRDVLVVTDPQGAVQRPVATDVGALGPAAIVPLWTGNGRVIICPVTRVGVPELFAMDVDTGEGARVSFTGGYSATTPFVVLPQTTTLVPKDTVLYVNPADGGSVWAVSLDGSSRQRILPELDHIVGPLQLTGDGTRLAGLRHDPGQEGESLWVADLMINKIYAVGDMPAQPRLFHWGKDGRTLYWIVETQLYRYTVAAGQEQALAALPPPTPTPTATPLPVEQHLVYYADNTFYRVKAYATPERLKEIPGAVAVPAGYALYGGRVAFPFQADIYLLQLVGGVPLSIYSLQDRGLGLVELTWSQQGNALLYSAVYTGDGITPTHSVDLGVIRFKSSGDEVQDVRRFNSLTAYSGTTPLLYDDTTREAFVASWSGERVFNRLDVYNVDTGEVRSVPIAGEGTAAVSADRRWVAATAYAAATQQGLIRLYDLAAEGPPSRTFSLPEGSFTSGPLRWSPDGQYLAFIVLSGTPGEVQKAEGIWVLRVDTFEARLIVPLDNPRAYLVGWETR